MMLTASYFSYLILHNKVYFLSFSLFPYITISSFFAAAAFYIWKRLKIYPARTAAQPHSALAVKYAPRSNVLCWCKPLLLKRRITFLRASSLRVLFLSDAARYGVEQTNTQPRAPGANRMRKGTGASPNCCTRHILHARVEVL